MGVATLAVRDVVHATPRTRILRLDLGATPFPYAAGQAVMVGLHGSPLRKPYSIASAPTETAGTGWLELLVQVDNSGSPDPHLELATPGTPLDVEGPFGHFGLPPTLEGGLLMVAGGTGIAPLRSMLLEALARPGGTPAVRVIYSARAVEELAYRDELEWLAGARRIDLWCTVTRDRSAGWPGRRGRIDRALLAQALPGVGATCCVCGPPAFVAGVTSGLRALGVPETRIVVERYSEE
jgi:NAD(P)H-flavin reductase